MASKKNKLKKSKAEKKGTAKKVAPKLSKAKQPLDIKKYGIALLILIVTAITFSSSLNNEFVNWDDDVNDLKEIEHKPQNKQHQHHNQEDRQLIVKALEELLDVVLTAKANDHKVQQLRPDQDGKHHRGHFGRLAHNRGQHAWGVKYIAAEQQAKHRVKIRTIRYEEGKPAFRSHVVLIDT